MELISSLMGKFIGVDVVAISMWVMFVNVLLTGIYRSLEIIKDKTASQIDNKAYDVLGKIIAVLMKIVEMVGFNPKHK